MRKKLSMALAALILLMGIPFFGARTAQAADYSNIRVLLSVGSAVQSFGMSVSGSYFIQENGASFSGGTLTAQYSGGKVVLTHSAKGQLYSGTSVNIMREKIAPSAGYLRATVSGVARSYLGHFTIKASGSGLRVINTVPLPHYLYGVVRGEMGNSFPLEALKAQAIAAKSYVLAGIAASGGGGDYDIGDTAEDQVYKGYVSSETLVISAVDATYDIGLYLGSSILRAFYAASNGGSTLLPSDVWSGTDRYTWDKAYARVSDPYDVANPLTPQETILLAYNGDSGMTSSVSSRLRAAVTSSMISGGYIGAGDSVKAVNQITKFEKISTYTAYITMQLTLASGQQTTVKCGIDMRQLMSNTVKNSMRLFIVTETKSGFSLFQGRYGHGVGMSQRGAEQMANSGMKYDKILSFYYPGAAIRSMGISAPADPVKPGGSQSSGDTSSAAAAGVTTGNVNFRKSASTSASILGTVPKGTNIPIYGEENSFYRTQYNGQSGYVHNSYVTVTATAPGDTGDTGTTDTGTALGAGAKAKVTASPRTSMRSRADSTSAIVANLLTNVVIDLLSDSGSYYYAHVQGYYGYVLKSDVTVTNAGSTSSGSASGASGATGQTTGNVNFRKGPGTSYSVIKLLKKGTTITLLGKSNGWYNAVVDGTEGYVSASYVKEVSGSVSSSPDTASPGTGDVVTAKGETTGKVNFRKGPGTSYSAMKMLARGTKLDIYSKSGGWYYVNVDGTKGYVSASYVKETGTVSAATTYAGVVVNEWVWLRSTPEAKSDNSNTIRQCPVGTNVTVYSMTGNFYKVSVDGQEGYMHKDFVQVSGN